MRIAGWGRYPVIDAEVIGGSRVSDIQRAVRAGPILARGLGRSYGDSSLAARALDMTSLDRFLEFDPASGLLTCEAGVSLSEILRVFVPRGWFPPVSPGTRYVTVGGAIAGDVHGKNHHKHGSFGDHVERMSLVVADGSLLEVSRSQHPELFHATCGGMGLTGVVVDATIRLLPIESRNVEEVVIKAPHLSAALDGLESNADATYSVAWLDCVARGQHLGRSLVMLGEHARDHDLRRRRVTRAARVPIEVPGVALNRGTVRAFNWLYYERVRTSPTRHTVSFEPYFYPLDGVRDWNRLYGRRGLMQYQFVVPFATGREALPELLKEISRSGLGSPLAVLKVFGPGNQNHLSFPDAGYTVALDFQVSRRALELADRLDPLVLDAGGRLYLSKDSRMSEDTFRASYPRLEEFERVRKEYGAQGVFMSAQSTRLGLA